MKKNAEIIKQREIEVNMRATIALCFRSIIDCWKHSLFSDDKRQTTAVTITIPSLADPETFNISTDKI